MRPAGSVDDEVEAHAAEAPVRALSGVPCGIERRAALADLLAGMAHEVANALGAVEGWARLARQKPTPEGREEALVRLERSAELTTKLARNMLRIARGDEALPYEALNLADLADAIVKMMVPLAQGVRVRIEAETPEEAWVQGRYADMVSVLWNLLQNAVEASSERGTVYLSLHTTGPWHCLQVRDEGEGIPEPVRGRLFEAYASGKPHGTGLGLALVAQAVREHGGQIEARNLEAGGAQFTVRLPVSTAPTPSKRPRREEPRRVSLAGLAVLVVEDDGPLREMVSTGLSLLGARVTHAASGAEALARPGPFDVAVIDLTLDDQRGDQLAHDLEAAGKVHAFVMVSGLSTLPPGVEPRGFGRWLRKPYRLEELTEALASLAALSDPEDGATP